MFETTCIAIVLFVGIDGNLSTDSEKTKSLLNADLQLGRSKLDRPIEVDFREITQVGNCTYMSNCDTLALTSVFCSKSNKRFLEGEKRGRVLLVESLPNPDNLTGGHTPADFRRMLGEATNESILVQFDSGPQRAAFRTISQKWTKGTFRPDGSLYVVVVELRTRIEAPGNLSGNELEKFVEFVKSASSQHPQEKLLALQICVHEKLASTE